MLWASCLSMLCVPLCVNKESEFLSWCPGFSSFPHQWFGHPRLRIVSQQTEHLSGRGARGVWTSCGSTLRSLFLLQPLHDMCCLPGGGAGPAGET